MQDIGLFFLCSHCFSLYFVCLSLADNFHIYTDLQQTTDQQRLSLLPEIESIERQLDRHLSIAILQAATVGLLLVHFSRVDMPSIGLVQRLSKMQRIRASLEKVGFVVCQIEPYVVGEVDCG